MVEISDKKLFIMFINWVLNSWVGWLVILYTIIRFGFWVLAGRFYSFLDALVALFFFVLGNTIFLLVIYAIINIVKKFKKK